MSVISCDKENIIMVADAIRRKTGQSDAMTLSQMAEAIGAIEGGELSNGTKWTKSNLDLTQNPNIDAVVNVNDMWFLTAHNKTSSYNTYYSKDGISWYQANVDDNLEFISYANGVWVAHGWDWYSLCHSEDGINWSWTLEQFFINDIKNANGLWVVATVNNGLYYSFNGGTWTQSNITSGTFYTVKNANGIWVAGSSGSGLYYSLDGKAWTQSNITSGYFKCIEYGNGIWVAGVPSTGGLYYSTDGKTWIQSNVIEEGFNVLTYSDGLWVASGYTVIDYGDSTADFYASGIWYSEDGKTWTLASAGEIKNIRHEHGIWVASGVDNGGLYYSLDGKSWTRSNVVSNEFNNIKNANGIWIAASKANGLYYSMDGITWTQSNITSGNSKIDYANGVWVAANENDVYYSIG